MCGSCGCEDALNPAAPPVHEAAAAAESSTASPATTAATRAVAAGTDAPAAQRPASRQLLLEQRLLAHNDTHAAANRLRFSQAGLRVVNLLSSPGAGKTALLEALAARHGSEQAPAGGGRPLRQAALVGDLATDHDARRLRAAGLPALQINTGRGCHLEAAEVSRALDRLEAEIAPLNRLDLLWIENVGNLVCPAGFDLGEELRVVLLACTEGEDKPLKYAPIFHNADLVLISKHDLAAVVGFDRSAATAAIARVAPRARVLAVSARSGEGLDQLAELLVGQALGAAALR